jgi:antitoxin component of RelBE/YafQ-DinJ toxin-antitoxin module
MARELIQTRADEDTADALEEYADDADITRSEAIRRAVRSHLADKGYPVAAADGAGQVTSELQELRDDVADVEDTLTETVDVLEERRAARAKLKRNQTVLGAVALGYIALTFALPDFGWLTTAWAAAGVGLAAAFLYQTYWIGVASDE